MVNTQIREEFRTSSRPSNAGGHPPPVTIHTWPERFNKQKPHSFEKATAPVDAENWISHIEKIFDVMGCEDAFKTRLAVYKFEVNALAWWKAYKQAKGGDAWLITRFLRLVGFIGATAGTEEEQAKNFHFSLPSHISNVIFCATSGKFSASSGKFPSDSGKISSTSGKFSTNRGIIPVNSGYSWSSILSSHC
nr:hypothetical protein [Tanacetum cinerariifolium]